MAYITSRDYETTIYSGDSRHDLKIWFNNVELQNAKNYCEKITIKSNIKNSIDNIFSLSNFIAKEVNIVFHDIDLSIIQDQIRISIGTLVNDSFEYVPIGIFNLQDNPTTDKNKTTITLRDNAVKFDFYYNALPLIESSGGTATKLQILQDICEQAGVECDIESFLHSEDEIAIYDDTITGRTYISYLAEQSGAIATINRDGELIFVYLNNLTTKELPRNILSSYEVGEKYKIARVVYESGIIKYEYPSDETEVDGNTLYLNSANPYISSQEQVQSIYNLVKDFEIYSLKLGKMFGNPALDPYDIIEITDNDKTYSTFASNTIDYSSGTIMANYDTTLSLSKLKENVSKNSNESFKKYAKTSIDNIKAEVDIAVGEVAELSSSVAELTVSVNSVESRVTTTETVIEEQGESIDELERTSLKSVTPYYALSTSNIIAPTTGWTTTMPTRQPNQYLWRKDLLTHQDGTTEETDPYVVTGDKGNDGTAGTDGKDAAIQSIEPPTDTSQMWYDITNNELKRYNSTTSTWEIVNDYGESINSLNDKYDDLDKGVSDINTNLNNNYTNNDELNRKLANQKNEITTEYITKINQSATLITAEITQNITTNGVSKVINNLVTIDINGINVAVNTSAFNTQITNEGFYCKNGNNTIAKIDNDGLLANNPKLNGKIEECGIIQKAQFIHTTFGKGLAHFYMG